jgi:hypothetical protein
MDWMRASNMVLDDRDSITEMARCSFSPLRHGAHPDFNPPRYFIEVKTAEENEVGHTPRSALRFIMEFYLHASLWRGA